MNLKRVTILPQGEHYCLRVGLFLSSIRDDTATAMKLPVGTRFQHLDKAEAERLAVLVDDWIGAEWDRVAAARRNRSRLTR